MSPLCHCGRFTIKGEPHQCHTPAQWTVKPLAPAEGIPDDRKLPKQGMTKAKRDKLAPEVSPWRAQLDRAARKAKR